MSEQKLSRKDWDDEAPTDVNKWLAIYEQDDNLFWDTSLGHIQNVVDELIWRLEESEKATEQRIIQLLKQHYPNRTWTDYIKRLIKGEQK